MALAIRITKAKFEALSPEFQAEYNADGDKHYKLDVTGLEPTDALERAKLRAEADLEDMKDDLRKTEKERDDLKKAQTTGEKDIAKISERYDRKIATLTEEKDAKITGLQTYIKNTTIGTQATALAREISTVPDLLADKIKARMDMDFTGDEPTVLFLGADGKPDAKMNIEALKKETLANPAYKGILIGTKASGGTASKGGLSGTGATFPQIGTEGAQPDIHSMSSEQYKTHIEAKREARTNRAAA